MNDRHIDDRPEAGYTPTTTRAGWGVGNPRLRITRDDERAEFALESDVVRIESAASNELRLADIDQLHATITHDDRDRRASPGQHRQSGGHRPLAVGRDVS